jgi:hypothetical protein
MDDALMEDGSTRTRSIPAPRIAIRGFNISTDHGGVTYLL